jgi:hypothetical protein
MSTTASTTASTTRVFSPDVARMIDRYRTCEFATVTRSGTAIAWPTCPLYDRAAGTFTLTTSVALPTKALNIRRDPRVSLLFSDPTGSGLDAPQQVIVQGRATCPDVVVTRPDGLERYWARLLSRQPGGKAYSNNAISRRLMDWYYFRLVITVEPELVDVREPLVRGDLLAPGSGPLKELGRYRDGVLSWGGADGRPTSSRVRPDPLADGRLALPALPGLREGTASILGHSHDEKLWKLRSFVSVGEVTRQAGGWAFTPQRYLSGASPDPRALVQTLTAARRTTKRYLEARGLPRPVVPWDAFRALYDRPDLA